MSSPITYCQSEIPPFKDFSFPGDHHAALIPDTLDLAACASLAIHAMTENPAPEADFEPHWGVQFVPVPFMWMDFASPSITPKFQEAVGLGRIMSGSEQNLHVDRRWMEVTLLRQGPDGLMYTPMEGRPWGQRYKPQTYSDIASAEMMGQWLCPFSNGQMLRTMALYAARDESDLWPQKIREVTDGLAALAVEAGEVAYFWPGPFYARSDPPADVRPRYHYHNVETSLIGLGLTTAYRQTGYEPARALATKLLSFMRKIFFREDGAYVTSQPGAIKSHLHGHARGLHAMADLGCINDDRELLDFVARSYRWTRETMELLTGFTPNVVPSACWEDPPIPGDMDEGRHLSFTRMDEYNGCEVAGLADMIAVALWLTEADTLDAWDDVDRWVRNMLCGSQMRHVDWVEHLPGAAGLTLDQDRGDLMAEAGLRPQPGQTTDRVMDRNRGAWPTGAAPNDFCHDESGGFGYGFVHGDTACAARALYYVWCRMLTYRDGKLNVNLLLNRASAWADVDSCLPFVGKVDIAIKEPVELRVRLAEWTQSRDVRVQVNGQDRSVTYDARFACIGAVKPGDMVTMTFPIEERTDVVHIQKRRYALLRRGNDVVSIHPRGRYYPFYQRDHDRTEEVRYRKVMRFVPGKEVAW